MLTAETITDDQIRALRAEAAAAGDAALVKICDCALAGCPSELQPCRATCADAINDARAMEA